MSAVQITKNFTFLITARMIDTFARLAIIPLIAGYLGTDLYGDYGFIIGFVFILTSFTFLGIERIIIREIAVKKELAASYLGVGIIIRWFYMTIAIAIIVVYTLIMDMNSDLIIGIFIATVGINCMNDALMYQAMFKAFEKMSYEVILTLIFQIFHFGLILIVIYFKLGFRYLFIALFIANFIRNICAILISRKFFVKPVLKVKLPLLKKLLNDSYPLGLFCLFMQGFVYVDIMLLKAFSTTVELSLFYASHNLILLVGTVSISLMSAFLPSLSRDATINFKELYNNYEKALKILAALSIFITIIFIVFSKKFILMLYNEEFINAIPALQIQSLGLVFIMLFNVIEFILIASNHQNKLIYCPAIALIMKGALGYFIIPIYGSLGASIIAVIGYIIYFSIAFYLVSKYVITIPIHKVIFKAALVAIVLGFSLYRYNDGNFYFMGIICLFIYTLSLYGLRYFQPDEICFFKSMMQKIVLRFHAALARK